MTWKRTKIGDFLTERKERMTPDEANISGISRLEKIDFSGNIHVKEGKNTNTGMIMVYPGDLVISGINVEKGALAVFEGNERILATIHYSSYQYNSESIDIEYLRYFARSSTFRKIILEQAGGGIKTEIKAKKFLSLQILLPDIDTQKIIVNTIKGVENEIKQVNDINENNIKLLKGLNSSILQDAIQGKLVPQDPSDEPASILIEKIQTEKAKLIAEGKLKKQKPLPLITPEEIPYELPKGWEWVRLNDIFDVRDGTHDTPMYHDRGFPLVTSKNLYSGRLDLSNIKYISKEDHENIAKRSKVDNGDILFAMIGSIGNPVLVDTDIDFSIKNVALIKYYSKELSNNKYLLYFLIYTQEIIKKMSSGAVQSFVSLNYLREYFFPLPPLQEQIRIVEKLDELMKSGERLDAQIQQSKERSERLMESVLQGVFNG